MPGKALIRGTLKTINNIPVRGGKIIATMVGSDAFEDGVRIAGRKIDATTDEDGSWQLARLDQRRSGARAHPDRVAHPA